MIVWQIQIKERIMIGLGQMNHSSSSDMNSHTMELRNLILMIFSICSLEMDSSPINSIDNIINREDTRIIKTTDMQISLKTISKDSCSYYRFCWSCSLGFSVNYSRNRLNFRSPNRNLSLCIENLSSLELITLLVAPLKIASWIM